MAKKNGDESKDKKEQEATEGRVLNCIFLMDN